MIEYILPYVRKIDNLGYMKNCLIDIAEKLFKM